MADLRLSDAEREQASRVLGDHYAEGRLSADEHGERLEAVWASRTRGELRPLFADLPGGSPVRPEPVLPWATLAAVQQTSRQLGRPRERRRTGPPFPLKLVLVAGLFAVLFTEPWVFFVVVGAWWLLASRGRIGRDRTPSSRGGPRRDDRRGEWDHWHGGLPGRS